jgi:predicted  nucleic acid-binding Zn-ribbon protein
VRSSLALSSKKGTQSEAKLRKAQLTKEEFNKIQEDIDREKQRRAKLESEVRHLKDQMSTIQKSVKSVIGMKR